MPPCDRKTSRGLREALSAYVSEAASARTSKDRHGVWVQERTTGSLGRISYEFVNGPLIVRWNEQDIEDLRDSLPAIVEAERASPHVWSLCRRDQIRIRTDLDPKPWFQQRTGTGWSIAALLDDIGVSHAAVVRWGTPVPLDAPGIYIVALTADPDRTGVTLREAPIGDHLLDTLRDRCNDLRVDGMPPSIDDLRRRIGSFWLKDETMLYIGKASKSVSARVAAYYRTPLGARSPHAGGWFLKTLANLDSLSVHFAAADDPEGVERDLLSTFVASIPEEARQRTHDPPLPLPFANIRMPGGRTKRHGITGATGCR